MTKELIEKIEIQGDNAVLLIKGLDPECMDGFRETTQSMWPGEKIIFILDSSGDVDIEQLDEAAMNAAGWYRK